MHSDQLILKKIKDSTLFDQEQTTLYKKPIHPSDHSIETDQTQTHFISNQENQLKEPFTQKAIHFHSFLSSREIEEYQNKQEKNQLNQDRNQLIHQNFLKLKHENKLSLQSQNLIQMILEKKSTVIQNGVCTQKQMKSAKIICEKSIKQKYEKLIKINLVEYNLPYFYKILLDLFQKFDDSIFYFSANNKETFFIQLKQNVLNNFNSIINIKQLKQFLMIYPSCYSVQWKQSSILQGKYDILVQIDQKENQNYRFDTMKQKLIDRVKYFHSLHLKNTNQEDQQKTLEDSKVWILSFDLEKLPQIEEQELPLRPDEVERLNLENKNNTKNTILQKIIENKTKKINLEQMKEKINSCKDKSILSDRICKLIKEKEQKLNQEKQFQEIRMEKRGNIENIKRIIEIIYIYYVHRRVSNIFYASIIEHICEQESINLTKSDVVSIVDNLAVDFSYWISLVKNKKGQILQINKSVPLQRMFQELSA